MSADYKLDTSTIGGSQIGAIAGLSRYDTPLTVYEAMTGGPLKEETMPMAVGVALEPWILARYAREVGMSVVKPPESVRSEAYPLARASLDGVRADGVGVEIKTVGVHAHRSGKEWGEPGTDQVPLSYLAQVCWYAGVTGRREWELVALVGHESLLRYPIRFESDEQFRALYAKAQEFMVTYVAPRIPPPPQTTDELAAYLSRRWEGRAPARQATEAEVALGYELRAARAATAQAEEAEAALRLRLEAAIGDAGGIVGPWGRIDWRRTKDGTKTDWKGIVESLEKMPDLCGIVRAARQGHTSATRGARPFTPRFTEDTGGQT